MSEHSEHRIKRLTMRSWRRGMKEMDLILGPFADTGLATLSPEQLDLYESLLGENDQDLYLWITARTRGDRAGPAHLSPLLDLIAHQAMDRFRPATPADK